MRPVEKNSLVRFLAIYLLSTSLLLVVIGVLYYEGRSQALFGEYFAKAKIIKQSLVHLDSTSAQQIAREQGFAIEIIANTHTMGNVQYTRGAVVREGVFYFISKAPRSSDGDSLLVLQNSHFEEEMQKTRRDLLLLFGVSLPCLFVFAFVLGRLFLEPIKQSYERLDNFIKDSTHEINTPLSTILMSLETLEPDQIPPKQWKKIARIQLATKSIVLIYNDLKLVNFPSAFPLLNTSIDLKHLIEERAEYFAPLASLKNITLTLKLTPLTTTTDQKRLSTILDNLLSNAIKYNNPNGWVKITLQDNTLTVEDNGIGIEPSKMQSIFERFVRDDESSGGFGIGLHLVKSLCEQLKISLRVDSKRDEGSVFVLGIKTT